MDASFVNIDLRTPLSLRTSFAFPLQTALSRREVVWGGVLLLVPGVGWILNMGHRIMIVHNMLHGREPWPAWRGYGQLFRHGLITFGGMVYYHVPAGIVAWYAWRTGSLALSVVAALLGMVATVAIPGYMTHYCHALDAREIYNPARALSRVAQGGRAYWHAWGIALAALAASFAGLLAFGVGFLVTSVWFWQVAGFSFARVFSQKFLAMQPRPAETAPRARAGVG
jgi:hypothetical protein